MLIIESPLFLLIIALGILIFFLALFKLLELWEKYKSNNKPIAKKEPQKVEKKEPEIVWEDDVFDEKNINNYLYDRFVVSPTIDDSFVDKQISEVFLDEKKYSEIRNKKVEIKVEPVQNLSEKEILYNKIEQLTNNNRTEKERLLDEFNHLSREMKLLLIENILQKID